MRAAAVATALISGGVTSATALLPQLHFAYLAPPLRIAVETAATLTALLVSFLVFGRFRRAPGLSELFLASALAMLALLNLFYLTRLALADVSSHETTVWVPLAGRLIGAGLFALAAFAPRGQPRPRLLPAAGAGGVTAGATLAVVLAGAFALRLPQHLAATPAPEPSALSDPRAYPALLALELAIAMFYGAAAVGFLGRCQRHGDEFLGWLAIAAILAAFSHVNYVLHLPLYSQWVHLGDALRLCFYLVLLAGSTREISSYWRARSVAAVAEERRRIARDLHDGLAQELAYLARNLDSLDGDTGEDTLKRFRRAVERAQIESRRAVSRLAAPRPQAVDVALAEATAEVAERLHLGLKLDLAPGIRVSAARAEALVRIACEAITNTARHSGTSQVNLNLERDGTRVRMRVSDRGRGFDISAPGDGFGLVSMRERARSVGGELRISSAPGRGSEVEAAL
jgi:signal transduction histidine kinase